jgi:tetratricopeptide (TPR) repeat protein
MPFDVNEAKNEMLTMCQKVCHNKPDEIAMINEFRESYSSEKAIWWYTRHGFPYRLTNTALRTEDIKMLYTFRSFITDLSKQLIEAYKQQRAKESLQSYVYRGLYMPLKELQRLKNNELISPNGFMSTSFTCNEALKFLIEPPQLDQVRVLFEIDIKKSELCVCANIKGLSFFPTEDEILFDIGAAFRIDEINKDIEYKVQIDNDSTMPLCVWHIKLSVTDKGLEKKNDYLTLVRKEVEQTSETVVFGQLLLDMGNYTMAKEYFLYLRQKLPKDDPMVGIILYNLGRTNSYAKDLSSALGFFKDALKYQEKDPSTHLVLTLIGIGQIYERSGLRPEAKAFYMQALEQCESKLGGYNCRPAAITFNALGSLYAEELQFDSAFECYNTSLEIFQRLQLPNNHPDIASIECNIGDVYRRKNDWDSARKQYEKSLQMFIEILPDEHPSIAYCHSLLGLFHLQKDQIEIARKHFQEALEKYKQNGLSDNHQNIQNSVHNLTRMTYEEALKNYSKIL